MEKSECRQKRNLRKEPNGEDDDAKKEFSKKERGNDIKNRLWICPTNRKRNRNWVEKSTALTKGGEGQRKGGETLAIRTMTRVGMHSQQLTTHTCQAEQTSPFRNRLRLNRCRREEDLEAAWERRSKDRGPREIDYTCNELDVMCG